MAPAARDQGPERNYYGNWKVDAKGGHNQEKGFSGIGNTGFGMKGQGYEVKGKGYVITVRADTTNLGEKTLEGSPTRGRSTPSRGPVRPPADVAEDPTAAQDLSREGVPKVIAAPLTRITSNLIHSIFVIVRMNKGHGEKQEIRQQMIITRHYPVLNCAIMSNHYLAVKLADLDLKTTSHWAALRMAYVIVMGMNVEYKRENRAADVKNPNQGRPVNNLRQLTRRTIMGEGDIGLPETARANMHDTEMATDEMMIKEMEAGRYTNRHLAHCAGNQLERINTWRGQSARIAGDYGRGTDVNHVTKELRLKRNCNIPHVQERALKKAVKRGRSCSPWWTTRIATSPTRRSTAWTARQPPPTSVSSWSGGSRGLASGHKRRSSLRSAGGALKAGLWQKSAGQQGRAVKERMATRRPPAGFKSPKANRRHLHSKAVKLIFKISSHDSVKINT